MEKKVQQKSFSRRKFLKTGLIGFGGLVLFKQVYDFQVQSRANGKIVIVGGGAAGITMAAYLSDMLRNPDIRLIEPNEIHHYQPGYTLIAGGVFEPEDVLKPNSKLIPGGVTWIKDSVAEINADGNSLVTKRSGRVDYDFLVLVPGIQMNFDLIGGISRGTLGEGNAHCIYDFKGAKRCFDAIIKMENQKGARMVFSDTYTKLKCGGAPKKICLLAEDHLQKNGSREYKNFDYYTNSTNLMTPSVYGDRLTGIYRERDIATHFIHRLVSVDTGSRKATFEKIPEPTLAPTPADAIYEKVVVDYDFLHLVPPMSAPDFVKDSGLSIREGNLRHGGWVDVDNETMVHVKYKNIISLGDVAGLPTSKTGAAIRIQAPLAAANLVSLMEGNEPDQRYEGYTACPIVTEYGKVLMCEFGYEKKLMPTIPWLDPGVERGMWWILKKHGLKPMYYHGMLKGLM